jgi:hypothetical protein
MREVRARVLNVLSRAQWPLVIGRHENRTVVVREGSITGVLLPAFDGPIGIECAPPVVDVRAVRFKPGRMSSAQLALAERCSSIVEIPSDCGGARTAAADGGLRRTLGRLIM